MYDNEQNSIIGITFFVFVCTLFYAYDPMFEAGKSG